MKYFFHPEAAKEYLDAVAYYAGIRPRLAESFIHAVETGIERILASPDTWKIMALHNEAYFYCLRFLGRLAVSAVRPGDRLWAMGYRRLHNYFGNLSSTIKKQRIQKNGCHPPL